jgi:hypothetical protein
LNGLFIPLGSRFEEDVTEFLSQASNIIKSEVRILNISKIAASLECTGGDLPHEVKRKVYDLVSFLGNNNGGRPPELFILADASDSRSQILEQIVLYLRLLLLIKFGINSRLQCFGFLQNGIEEDVYQKRFEFLTRIQRLKADDYQNKDSLPPFSMTESSDFNWAGPLIDRFFALRLPPENSKPDYGVLLRYCRLCLEGAIGFEDYTHFSSYTINGLLINSNADYIRAIAEKAFFYRSREIIRNG